MTVSHLRSGRIAMLLAASLVVAACGGTSAPDTSGTALAGDTVAEGIPGSEEFGLTMAGLARRVEQVEATIGSCMAEAGFEYIPVDFDTIRAAQAADKSLPGINDEDFLSQYGFGITTRVGQPNAMIEIARGQNLAIIETLSPEDRVAYDRTLLGEAVDVSFVVGLEDEDFAETGGCTREAVKAFFTAEEIAGSYVNPGDSLIENDPRMVGAIAAWSGCLAEDGYDYDHPDDLDDDLSDRMDAIVGDQDPVALTGDGANALLELQGFERAIAPLAEDCEDEHIVPVEEAIEIELYGAPQG